MTTVLTIGQDGTVTHTDPNISLVLGYSSGELEGHPLKQLIASAEDNPLSPDYASYHETGRPLTVTLRHGRGYFMAARVIVRKARAEKAPSRAPATPKAPEKIAARPTDRSHDRANIARTKAMLAHIRECLSSGGLPLEFQLIESLNIKADGLAFEVLARLRGANGSSVAMTPADFLPLIEQFELSRRLDRQVIKQTLCHLHRHPELSATLGYCGFNLSLGSLQDRTFPGFIARALEKTGLNPGALCFEIPAHHAVTYTADCRQTCRMLRRLGCKTALDGAGQSMDSYRLAGRLPVDYIKLAPELLEGLQNEPTHLVMMEALQRIAKATDKVSIATSVENHIARQRVQNLGIHLIQGKLVSAPRPLKELGSSDRGTWQAGAIA
ncbi:sensor domain-containing phosphodiesterase [Marinobacter zhanjiangensis]|uniref:sensor domain-containing phosphodiesterase n=1 Tax=Marinobacter zhanjiangensis TaxID=578215 RepID=UPI001677A1F6|nr:EAL domain-containing protein [Marinobacter zhanjiangensis]